MLSSGRKAYRSATCDMFAVRAYTSFDTEIFCVEPYDGNPEHWLDFLRNFELRMIRDYAKGEETYYSPEIEVLQGTDLGGVINERDFGANMAADYNVTVLSVPSDPHSPMINVRRSPGVIEQMAHRKAHTRRNAHLFLIP